MRLCPPGYALDVEVVIDIDVVHRAVASARPASKREGRHHIVVDAAERSNRSRRVDDDAPGVDDVGELADDLIIAREDDRGMPDPTGVIHVHANLQCLVNRFRAIDRKHRE